MTTLTQYTPSSLTKLAEVNMLPLASRAALHVAYIIAVWAERSRTRAVLKHLTDANLSDVGLTRAEALKESAKWFWRP